MKHVIVATTNRAKIAQVESALAPIGVSVSGVDGIEHLPEVVEDGETLRENARKKATAYCRATGKRVLSMDNGLYLDGLPDAKQPGTHVRRILPGGRPATDLEALDYYQGLIASLGERVQGRWEFALCVADPDGSVWETVIVYPRVFTSARSEAVIPGYPLESLQIRPEDGRYVSELSEEERARFWQEGIGARLQDFIRSIP